MTDISMIAQLREFGFTESEAKVYVALLEGGAVSGYEASKLSGVARSKIYTILEALIQRGAVLSSSDGRATLYRAESPAHLAELLRGEMDRGLRNLALAAEGLVCGQNDERIWHLGSWESARSRCLRMIREAREQVMLQIWADELDEELEDAIERRQALRDVHPEPLLPRL